MTENLRLGGSNVKCLSRRRKSLGTEPQWQF